jgi:cytoskeletal protein CcmA (bactofilin family)
MSFMRNNSNNSPNNANRPGEAEVVTPPFRPSFGNNEVEPAPDMPSSMMDDPNRARVFERDPRTMATPPERCADVMGAGSKWKGTLIVQDSVRIDGQVTGEVEAKGTIHISEGAQVEAKLRAAFVVIAGSFRGEVKALERIELLPKSKVQGELETKALTVLDGAIFDGAIRMSTEKADTASSGGARNRGAAPAESNGVHAESRA